MMPVSNSKSLLIKAGLFIVTSITTTLSGAELMFGRSFIYGSTLSWTEFLQGMEYSVPFLLILTVHEFGHYFTARYYKVNVSLPSYIPMWLGFISPLSIGTMGAFIRIRSYIRSKKQYFDIGIAGPLAGFAVAVVVLLYGFTHLPEPTHVFEIHPEFESFGEHYAERVYSMDTVLYKKDFARTDRYNYEYTPDSVKYSTKVPSVRVGKNLLFIFFEEYVVSDKSRIPNAYEMMHYPWLFAGFLALLFTALNLLPIGQLDGGHVIYGLFGNKWHRKISQSAFVVFITYAGLGAVTPYQSVGDIFLHGGLYVAFLYFILKGLKKPSMETTIVALSIFVVQLLIGLFFPTVEGYQGWLFFSFLIGRFLGVYHPVAKDESPLDTNRKILGWLALLVFILSFSPQPLMIG